jgi:hypothetical protein
VYCRLRSFVAQVKVRPVDQEGDATLWLVSQPGPWAHGMVEFSQRAMGSVRIQRWMSLLWRKLVPVVKRPVAARSLTAVSCRSPSLLLEHERYRALY